LGAATQALSSLFKPIRDVVCYSHTARNHGGTRCNKAIEGEEPGALGVVPALPECSYLLRLQGDASLNNIALCVVRACGPWNDHATGGKSSKSQKRAKLGSLDDEVQGGALDDPAAVVARVAIVRPNVRGEAGPTAR